MESPAHSAIASVSPDRVEATAAAFRAGVDLYGSMGSPLYAALSGACAEDRELMALASHCMPTAPVSHLISCVHFMLLRDPGDPLAQHFATLTPDPAPPAEAFPDFARYCRQHREEILALIHTHTVQMTYAERCGPLMVGLSIVSERTGEPLNLVEIGCSAGVLLAFDKFQYDLGARGRIGPGDAPLVLAPAISGGPMFRIPEIGTRTGIDLHIMDVTSEDQRRWILASCFPEFRDQQARLATALDVVAATRIRWLEGDGLALLPKVIAETPDPLCIYHSACLAHWPSEAKTALNDLLLETSRRRAICRLGIEPTQQFDDWSVGRAVAGKPDRDAGHPVEIAIYDYQDGTLEKRVVARTTTNFDSILWVG